MYKNAILICISIVIIIIFLIGKKSYENFNPEGIDNLHSVFNTNQIITDNILTTGNLSTNTITTQKVNSQNSMITNVNNIPMDKLIMDIDHLHNMTNIGGLMITQRGTLPLFQGNQNINIGGQPRGSNYILPVLAIFLFKGWSIVLSNSNSTFGTYTNDKNNLMYLNLQDPSKPYYMPININTSTLQTYTLTKIQ